MRRLRRRSFAIRQAPVQSWRQGFAALALILFAFQSYVIQTHVHLLWRGSSDAFVRAAGLAHLSKAPSPDKQKPADDPANCPICQDVLLAGHFTTPAVIPLLPPLLAGIAGAPLLALPAIIATTSHDWQGRAPPRA